ncbi:MAG TPA: hypothetical protein DDW49_11750 [Deltaproteobacteria bacterium]|nr:MAG: hypothetical protein A2048_02575 [Deltaproteobacteria bacterium GWA2_45_12]HBF14040.1 hypothetical protein [Deltaproteobacteria bacterium]
MIQAISLIRFFTLLAAIGTLAACGGSSGGSSSGSSSSSGTIFSGEDLEGGAVSAVTVASDNSATINFGMVSNSTEYVVAIYNYSEDGSTEAYEVGSSLSSLNPKAMLGKALMAENMTEDFHEMLRQDEASLDLEALRTNSKSGSKALMSAAAMKAATVGDQRTFKVLNSLSSSSTTTITAEVVHISDYCIVYMDTRDTSSLSAADLSTIFENVDERMPDQIARFGSLPDVDENGKALCVFTREVNELGGSGGIVTGYFHAINEFPTSVYSQSNDADMIVGAIPDPSGSFGVAISKSFMMNNIYQGLIFHELQHAQNFNNHYLVNDGDLEYSFLNEGLSHLSEDIQYDMSTAGIENYSRVSGYLESIDSLCITCGASLYQRGGIYLLLRYLYEQAEKGNLPNATSGDDLINRLTDTTNTSVENIIRAAYGDSVSVDGQFRALMGQFGLAVFLSGTGLSDNDQLNFDGIDLRGAADDNRGTVLQGPGINSLSSFPTTSTVANSSISYVELTGEQINELSGTVSIQLGDSAEAGIYLIQTGL